MVSAPGPARSMGPTEETTVPPSPSRRPPTRSATACAVSPAEVTRSAAGLELLNDSLGQIQRLVGGDDPAVGRAHVEDERVVTRGANPFDHAVDLALDRFQQLTLPGGGLLLQLLGPLLQFLLLPGEFLPLGLALGRAQHDRLLLEVRRGGIEGRLELLNLRPIGLD